MIQTNLPVILLKSDILFPYSEIRFEFSLAKEKLVLENACQYYDGQVLMISLMDPLEENPSISDLPSFGVIGKIKSKITLSNGKGRVVIVGMERVQVLNYLEKWKMIMVIWILL